MKPNDNSWQLSSLELSKRLKELGVKQESLWYWDLRRKKEDCDVGDKPKDDWILSYEECYQGDRDDLISAFTVAELGEMLPNGLIYETYTGIKGHKVYSISEKNKKDNGSFGFADISEANARAKMLIYLLENKLIQRGGEQNG